MPEFNFVDMDFDGDVDGVDPLGFDFLPRYLTQDQNRDGDCGESRQL